jgi:hypothetical protein
VKIRSRARSRTSSFVAALSLGFAVAVAAVAPPAGAQANKVEASAKALQKKAMEEDYLMTEFAKAEEKLEKALSQCGAQCSAAVRALLRRDLATVQIVGGGDKDKGIGNFVEALKLDPKVQLEKDFRTKELDAAFAEAKKRAPAGATPAAPAGGGETGEQPAGDFVHEPVAEQQIRTAIPIYAEYGGEEQILRVVARYKGFGMTEWKTVELKKMGEKGWGAVLPCGDVQQGTTKYYLQGFNAANDPVATSGDRNNPFNVKVTREKVAEPPHLPGQAPPSQCADTGDCPPNFPGCKKDGGGEVKASEVKGKDGGEFCEEDTECRSGTCKENKCTEPEGPSKAPKIWVGLFGAFDFAFVPSQNDVCSINRLATPTSTPEERAVQLLPKNDKNYYCVANDGTDYPWRPEAPNPRNDEHVNLVEGVSNKVSGGTAFGNVRIMASIDYAATPNLLVGGRLGFVLNKYSADAAGIDGRNFAPIHLELRGTWVFGDDPLAKKGFAPYVFGGAGVAPFEAAVKVSVVERTTPRPGSTCPANTDRHCQDVDAWQLAGPGFFTMGGGGRYAFTPGSKGRTRAALMGGLRFNLAFGNSTAPSIGPELGVVVGF